jgi:hypothetical protein
MSRAAFTDPATPGVANVLQNFSIEIVDDLAEGSQLVDT